MTVTKTNQAPNTVSKFREAMKLNGFVVSFSVAARILVDAGICENTGTGYVLKSA